MVVSIPGNRIAYNISEQLDSKAGQDIDGLKKTKLTPEYLHKMSKEVYNFPIMDGHEHGHGDDHIDYERKRPVLGDLIDASEPGIPTMILLEEKLYETWYHDRTVLIGDAAHKMHFSSGQGCVNAFQDAVVLANCLYEISDGREPATQAMITAAFKDYRDQRYSHAKFQVTTGHVMANVLCGQVSRGVTHPFQFTITPFLRISEFQTSVLIHPNMYISM